MPIVRLSSHWRTLGDTGIAANSGSVNAAKRGKPNTLSTSRSSAMANATLMANSDSSRDMLPVLARNGTLFSRRANRALQVPLASPNSVHS